MKVNLRLFIEIEICGVWYILKPEDVAVLNIPCPRLTDTVWNPKMWCSLVKDNHPFIAMTTDYKNPHQYIVPIYDKYVIGNLLPKDTTERLKERYSLSLKMDNAYGLTVFRPEWFFDTSYWHRKLDEHSTMELHYFDLLEDYTSWFKMARGLLSEFDGVRFFVWLEY